MNCVNENDSVNNARNTCEEYAADAAFDRLFGTDVFNEFVLSEKRSDKICESITDPGGYKRKKINVFTSFRYSLYKCLQTARVRLKHIAALF